jgi:hypothetical protein
MASRLRFGPDRLIAVKGNERDPGPSWQEGLPGARLRVIKRSPTVAAPRKDTPVVSFTRTVESFLPRGKKLIVLFLVLLVFNLILFPARARCLDVLSGEAGPVLDVRFGYSPEEVHAYAGALGPKGRRLYALTQITLDLAYPALYSLFLSGLLVAVLSRGFSGRRGIAWLVTIPFGIALIDVAENLSIIALLGRFPATPLGLAHLASAFTVDKWLAAGVAAVVLLVGLAAWGIRGLRGRGSDAMPESG